MGNEFEVYRDAEGNNHLIFDKSALYDDSQLGNQLSDFEVLRILGSYNKKNAISKVRCLKNNKIYSMKKIDLTAIKKDEEKKLFFEQMEKLKSLNHSHLLKYYKTFQDDKNNLYLIYDYMNNSDLNSLIKAHCNLKKEVKEETVWNILLQCLSGISYLHKENLASLAIRPTNIFLNNEQNTKIGLFYETPKLEDKDYDIRDDVYFIGRYFYKMKLKVIASHGIIDGRSIFDLFELFASYAFGKEINENLKNYRNQPVLYEFGKKDWFTEEITNNKLDDPYTSIIIKDIKINPSVTLPSHVINPQWEVDYPPISKFCRKHGITPQSILMAIQNDAIRIFNQGKFNNEIDTIPIAVYIPVDNRHSPYATKLLKNSLFFSHVGIVFPLILPEKDKLKNMKNCAKVLKDALNTTQSCDVAYSSANMRNFETHELTYPQHYPNPATYVFASHLGLVGVGYDDIQFRSHSPVYEGMYWPNLYGFHNKKTFAFMFNIPYNCPKNFFESVKTTSLKYYDYILNDIKE